MASVEYVDRRTGERVQESVMGDNALRFAYETLLGRTLWPVLFGSKLISALLGAYYDSPRSKKAIKALAAIPGCRADEAEKPLAEYSSFNSFFTRKLKAGARPLGEGIVSPADGRLRLYLNADLDSPFPLKGATKTLRTLFASRTSHFAPRTSPFAPRTSHFAPRTSHFLLPPSLDLVVLRLAPVDYHRFHFPCDCEVVGVPRVIPGKYHSVNPIALLKYPNVYADNERQIVAARAAFGDFWMIDVGAFGVGTIVQTFSGASQKKGAERGYFKFGGSTVILAFPAGAARFADDLVANSAQGLETRVLALESIAH